MPAAPGRLEATPVSTLVNDVKNNGPEVVQPLPLAGPSDGPPRRRHPVRGPMTDVREVATTPGRAAVG